MHLLQYLLISLLSGVICLNNMITMLTCKQLMKDRIQKFSSNKINKKKTLYNVLNTNKAKTKDYDDYEIDFSSNMKHKNKKSQPLISRFSSHENYAAKWQEYGDYYIGYENLKLLNNQLIQFQENRSKIHKSTLLNELTLTYFARFHNNMREEYQYEHSIVENRLKTWSTKRLSIEGYALFAMQMTFKGNLYQDKVVRCSCSDREFLGFHRFSVGDTVRVSKSESRLGPLGPTALEGVVLDRRIRYIDICIRGTDSVKLDTEEKYRLDCFVNRVSYDRMLESLQLLLQSPVTSSSIGTTTSSSSSSGTSTTGSVAFPTELKISKVLKDLLLYSFPNSIIRLARSTGGLKLALPVLTTLLSQTTDGDIDNTDLSTIGDVIISTGSTSSTGISNDLEMITTAVSVDDETIETAITNKDKIQENSNSQINIRGIDNIRSNLGLGKEVESLNNNNSSSASSSNAKPVTVAAALSKLKSRARSMTIFSDSSDESNKATMKLFPANLQHRIRILVKEESDRNMNIVYQPVFRTNSRLRAVALLPELSNLNATNPSPTPRTSTPDTIRDTNTELTVEVELDEEKSKSGTNRNLNNNNNRIYTSYEVNSAILNLENIYANRVINKLNPSQIHAVVTAIERPLSLIQGPPGTGKTKTACALVTTLTILKQQRMMEGGSRSQGLKLDKMLACAHSNVAADNLLEGIHTLLGDAVVRVGRPANVRSGLWNVTLDARLQQNEQWVDARTSLDSAIKSYNLAKELGGPELGGAQRVLTVAKKRFDFIEHKSIYSILSSAEVIVTTCIGAGADLLREYTTNEKVRFRTVLVDEAAQCTESAIFPSLTYGCERLVLIGDQNQLPPVVLSPLALESGLGVSLFARLVSAGMDTLLLDQQYRMHPAIAQFPSDSFYGGSLQSKIHASDRPLPKGFEWPNKHIPIAFIDVTPSYLPNNANNNSVDNLNSVNHPMISIKLDQVIIPPNIEDFNINKDSKTTTNGFESVSNSTNQSSYYNEAEAIIVEKVLDSLLLLTTTATTTTTTQEPVLCLRDIGIISPYNAQVRVLTDRFRSRGWIEATANAATDNIDESTTDFSKSGDTSIINRNRYYKNIQNKPTVNLNNSSTTNINDSNNIKSLTTSTNTSSLSMSSFQRMKENLKEKFHQEAMSELKSLANEYKQSNNKQTSPTTTTSIERGSDTTISDTSEDESSDELSEQDIESAVRFYNSTNLGLFYKVDNDDEEANNNNILNTKEVLNKQSYTNIITSNSSNELEVRSVDGFQGREKEVIIISAVRSNEYGKVGFLSDWRRLNVAITRAKSGLIVVGDSKTLLNDKYWKSFIEYCKSNNCYVLNKNEMNNSI